MGNGLSLEDPAVRAALQTQDCLEVHRDTDTISRRYRSGSTLSGLDRFQSATVWGHAFAFADLLTQYAGSEVPSRPRLTRSGKPSPATALAVRPSRATI